jgi:cytochrome c biogenesis protein CcdA/thiol-disulfide isomerase/thioredoxin
MIIALLSLVAGFLSVLAPCVLPLLPIIIGGSFTGIENRKRPYVIVASLVTSLILFTLLLKASTTLIGIDPKVWSYLSGGIVIALGLVMLFPLAWDTIIGRLGLQARSQQLLGKAGKTKNGTASAILTGFALGPVFSSCSPLYAWVIATVLPESTAKGLVYLAMYSIGLAIALLGIALLGRKMIDRIKWASNPHGMFQKVIAILFILVGFAVATGYDKKIQTYLVDKDFLNLKTLEEKLVPEEDEPTNQLRVNSNVEDASYFNVEPYAAPELAGLQEWINSDPLTLTSLRGKVVMIDFWTYSCINCVRTLPYLQKWHETYADDGFVLIGVHAPEFAFEKVPTNVRRAVSERALTYPIALDNDFVTWRAYKNRFWPANYLIDKNGQVRRTHFGEGEYTETEAAIRALLAEAGAENLSNMTTKDSVPPISRNQTPETYIGSERAERITNENFSIGENSYTLAEALDTNLWSLGGTWNVSNEYATCTDACKLRLRYQAKTVYAVFSGSGTITVNGELKRITADDIALLVENESATNQLLELELSPGLSLHAFTFGS